ncbi:MAG: hypothetical protein RML94_02595 [Bacteroidia bacterium]|nr:hypothetical protein [Bacteroidia bacterium]
MKKENKTIIEKAKITLISQGTDAKNRIVFFLQVEDYYTVQVPELGVLKSFRNKEQAEIAYKQALSESHA